jgi:hypothetical protein
MKVIRETITRSVIFGGIKKLHHWKKSQVLSYVNGVVVGYSPHDATDGSSDHRLSNRTWLCIRLHLNPFIWQLVWHYMDDKDPTELWDALEHKDTISENDRLLYICEQLFDFRIDAAKSIVKQAHKFELLSWMIVSLGCPIPNRVVAAGIIAKLPTS